MDDNELKKKLIRLGVKEIDADTLMKVANNKKTSVSRVFIMSLSGLYMGTATLVGIYFLFIHEMNEKEVIAFSFIYISLVLVIYFLTTSLKTFFWSLKVLVNLRGR